jgi:hypothetical protein
VDEAKDIDELVGVAVQTSNLAIDENAERDLDRVAAFGMGLRRAAGGLSIDDPRGLKRRVHAELGGALVRALFGGDRVAMRMAEGALELALTLRSTQSRVSPILEQPYRTRPLARRVIHEFLSLRCSWCAGSGQQEIRAGRAIRPLASARNARLQTCNACGGSGRAAVDKVARRQAIEMQGEGMPRAEFMEQWMPVYTLAAALCDKAIGDLRRPVRHALRDRVHLTAGAGCG